jgi:5'-AMP-activated protein kinase beta subunit, interaction domain
VDENDNDDSDPGSFGVAAAPYLPPPPVLPSQCRMLILNAKREEGRGGGGTLSSGVGAGGKHALREREREERRSGRQARSALGMTSTTTTTTSSSTSNTHHHHRGHPHTEHKPGEPSTTHRPLDVHGLADDASVLPVPSHAMLQHVSTSTIRNGVLAIATSTRYKQKVRVPFLPDVVFLLGVLLIDFID